MLVARALTAAARGEARRTLAVRALVYRERGDPAKVLRVESSELEETLRDGQVHVEWEASPVNPADINQLQGVYAVRPDLPAVGGNEGCGRVTAVGARVSRLRVGDRVIPARSGLGTWRTAGAHAAADLFALDARFDRNAAAMLQVNPSTAYRLLHDFVSLRAGDRVVQNGANSAVGRYVIQIAKQLQLDLINVVRSRDDIGALKAELAALGATAVHTEEEFAKAARDLADGRLALNCVGGRSSLSLARTLGHRGCMVTYGGMSKLPVQAPTAPFIFKQLRLEGFWMSRWYDEGNAEERERMYSQLADWYASGALQTTAVREVPLDDFATAVDAAMSTSNVKQLFVMS